MQVVHAPTGVFVIVGRLAVDGVADLPAVHALQDGFSLTALSVYQGGTPPAAVSGVPVSHPGIGEELKWWEELRLALAAFPPTAADAHYLAICREFGLLEASSPYLQPDPALARTLMAGRLKSAEGKVEKEIRWIGLWNKENQ
jgi:hypothetical protein